MLVQESVIQDSNCFLLDRRNDLQHNHFQIPLQSVRLFLGDLPLRYLHHYFLQHISLHSLLLLRLLHQLLPYLAHRHHHSQYLPHIHHLPHVVLHLHPQFRLHLYLQLHCLLIFRYVFYTWFMLSIFIIAFIFIVTLTLFKIIL